MQKPYTSYVCLEVIAAGQKKDWPAEKVTKVIRRKLKSYPEDIVPSKLSELASESWVELPGENSNGRFKITRRGKLELEVLADRYRHVRAERRNRVWMISTITVSVLLVVFTLWRLRVSGAF